MVKASNSDTTADIAPALSETSAFEAETTLTKASTPPPFGEEMLETNGEGFDRVEALLNLDDGALHNPPDNYLSQIDALVSDGGGSLYRYYLDPGPPALMAVPMQERCGFCQEVTHVVVESVAHLLDLERNNPTLAPPKNVVQIPITRQEYNEILGMTRERDALDCPFLRARQRIVTAIRTPQFAVATVLFVAGILLAARMKNIL